jgi:ABC-type Mn2+/Zn2+ transport system permease subunit
MLLGSMAIGAFTTGLGVFISMKLDVPASAGAVLTQTVIFIGVLVYTTLIAHRQATLLHADIG